MSEEGFTAVITGGSRGIGAELAQRLLRQGYRVITIAQEHPDFDHPMLRSVVQDLTDAEATRRLSEEISTSERVTHFVHNAGMILPSMVADVGEDDLGVLTQLHLNSALAFTQAFLPAMKAAGFGRIVFTSSRAALGVPTRTAYSATKAGMIGMARTWALELAPNGITVNVVAPGPIRTDNFWDIVPKDSPQEEALANRIPVGRLGSPADVANAIAFFCDPASGFVTGQTLYVCGGASIGTLQI